LSKRTTNKEKTQMQKKKAIITTFAILGGLGLASVGASAAMASTPSAPPSTSTSSSAASSETPDAPETGGAAESATPSDGPGGHADAPGVDVNHNGGNTEQ
jgi:hypothetical protein